MCYEYAKQNDLIVLDAYIDRAMTGTNDNRPAFQKMIRDSEKQQWQAVLVYKLDRFARNNYESVVNKKRLKDNNVKLISAMENITDTPEGRMMECLLEGMNQYFSVECFYGHYLYDAPIYRLSSSRCSTVKIASQRQKFITENI